MFLQPDRTWMWHPHFTEDRTDTAGLFVHFKKDVLLEELVPSLPIHITADTRYKLYINNRLVTFGPVKGDESMWFYDEVDVGPYLRLGQNRISVHVLRFFHGTKYAASFARLPTGGLRITVPGKDVSWIDQLESSASWLTAIDTSTLLRVDELEDFFLHVYEKSTGLKNEGLNWVPAKVLEYKIATGMSTPWTLSPRMIPPLQIRKASFSALHNIKSDVEVGVWESKLIRSVESRTDTEPLVLARGTHHQIDLEVPYLLTAFIRFRFKRPAIAGSTVEVIYSESYEEEPKRVPWERRKGDRCDYTKSLYGPRDMYQLGGINAATKGLGYHENEAIEEHFAPFHFRTFRFIRLKIDVGSSELGFEGVDINKVNYPLEIHASFEAPGSVSDADKLLTTSIRTLANCMHDCYEDCPFYEQMQYSMDTRSMALFTYNLSGDDRLARQAIIQIHNSFKANIGLTSCRAPTNERCIIPSFSLYWIFMLQDHLLYFNDVQFLVRFLPAVDAILSYFAARVGEQGLVRLENTPGIWHFADWTRQWYPYGIPSVIDRTGISTFFNQVYACALSTAAQLAQGLGRDDVAGRYYAQSGQIVSAIRKHCFNGELYADTLVSSAAATDYSQHCQVWAAMSGCVSGPSASSLLRKSLAGAATGQLVKESISMSFYTLRALSLAGGSLYDEKFHEFWNPWREQLAQNLTTWVEEGEAQRSDCHAWGSSPIYEFLVEVAGIRPLEPGWSTIGFAPRVRLFREINASVPMPMVGGRPRGVVSVSWRRTSKDCVKVRLRIRIDSGRPASVHISLPGLTQVIVASEGEWTFNVELEDAECHYP